ncbi:DUF721 domain-containing protein [Jannaschia seohaensis]|uniref:DUF721 domain-containing protein n=1 Tax=Jannaschia seohaensis TaxID=475081 RepID=A0A2Y9C813_9RHOB|nr:DciA family protein [Jannaschia seohaensis]PWJ17430.1 hypothetical protein BCF38_10640 [Jannaschia seohaensis]SSA47493.1 hypothetical protein SAMN05421539_10640 [Jannaschia seohaensis]
MATLIDRDVKRLGQTRGFSETRLLTHWAEIAGGEIAAICRPVKVGYPRGGFGAVLTVLTTGAQAQMLQMKLPQLIDRVNATYGYQAISRIAITQTAATGFAEGQAEFTPKPRAPKAPSPEAMVKARAQAQGVSDSGLRESLERLGANIISKRRN